MTTELRQDVSQDSAAGGGHPLDPLSAAEIAAVTALVRAHPAVTGASTFRAVALAEPAKNAVSEFENGGDRPERAALAIVYNRDDRMIREFTVSLSSQSVVSVRERPGMQPSLAFPEFVAAQAAIKAHPGWQEAMRKRGVTDLEHVQVHPWPPGIVDERAGVAGHRIGNGMTFIGLDADDNVFARPIEGLVVPVDLDTATVLRVDDTGVVAPPPTSGNYTPERFTAADNTPSLPAVRDGVRAIEVIQPQGPSFELDGYALRWQNWSLRVGFTPREGIVLHQVRYTDQGRERSILARASLSEMWVPYGDPAPLHRIKAVFDEGEAGLGAMTNSLRLGCDCLGEIRYLGGVLADYDGNPVTIGNAICIHEEDTGVVWKHTRQTGTSPADAAAEVRRGRRLVISSFSTVGNYDYGFFWYLHTDGSIAYEVKLTGIISTGGMAPGEVPAFGTAVAPGVYGPNHQHVFSVRLDMAIDGDHNSVFEVDSVPVPTGPDNPFGNAWQARETVLEDESAAQRVANPATARTWTIVNERSVNSLGRPVGYQLMPGPATLPLLSPDSPAMRRAGFATRHLWVTPYRPGELYAAGEYPYQSGPDDGLPAYVRGNQSVRDTDIVVWHTLVSHHVVRPEDWPVMPVTTVGMHLRPTGFFDANPALDLPRPHHAGHCEDDSCCSGKADASDGD